jgi:hypothetical protein
VPRQVRLDDIGVPPASPWCDRWHAACRSTADGARKRDPIRIAMSREHDMFGRNVLATACALAVTFAACDAPRAQSAATQPAAIEEWAHDFTVLTMAPDGAWGTATDPRINRAIFLAIENCKAMSGAKIGCGAYMTSVRGGWSLGIRCGRENIIVADRDLAEAEERARRREAELRALYAPNMPSCARLVTVDPNGGVVMPQLGFSGGRRVAR